MKISVIVTFLVAVVVVLGGWYAYTTYYQSATPLPAPAITVDTNLYGTDYVPPPAASSTPGVLVRLTATSSIVTYTKTGFSPATTTIKKGGTVTFVNEKGDLMWVASDPHPEHSGYSGTPQAQHCPDTAGVAFDQCANGDSYSFVFDKVGTWGYHNHSSHKDTGTIIVIE